MALVGTLSFNFQVTLPLMARYAFHGTAGTYAALTTAMAVGAVTGALVSGTRERIESNLLATAAFAFGAFSLVAAAAPTLGLELVALAVTGAASVTFAASINSTLQLEAAPAMRGRVMALYSVVFLGSTPIGAPIAGWLAGAAGPRSTLVMAGVAALIGGMGLKLALRPRAELQAEHAADGAQAVDQPLHVRERVVHGERRARRRGDAEPAHERLRTVVTGPHAHAGASKDLPDVVRVRALKRERDQRPALGRLGRAVHGKPRHL
jgi:MFS family permease